MKTLTNMPIIKRIWSKIREYRIFKKHKKVSNFWRDLIDAYFHNKLERFSFKKKKKLDTEKIIWQYWGQGVNECNIPQVVKYCFESVDKYSNDYIIIRLDDSSISDYIDLPDFLIEKLNSGLISKTFFSDVLRVILLKTYGGIWLDATILLTDSIPKYMISGNYFVFQRDHNVIDKDFWKKSYAYYWNWDSRFKVNMLTSFFYSKPNDVVVTTLCDLLLNYWKNNDQAIDYFFFQILYNDLTLGYLKDYKCIVFSDTKPHLLQVKFNGSLDNLSYDDILSQISIHKMSYFDKFGLNRMKNFIEKM